MKTKRKEGERERKRCRKKERINEFEEKEEGRWKKDVNKGRKEQ
jgi:hypothetical protein